MFASKWMCLDILPLVGILDFPYIESNPPPCQSPKMSAPIETIKSAKEKS
jgi:hypothetical protein